MRAISRKAVREVDRAAVERYEIPSICLMENAGSGAARVVSRLESARSGAVLCLAGPGQNGGDAFVVARHLSVAGRAVSIALIGSRSGEGPPGDAGTNLAIVRALSLPLLDLRVPGAADRLAEALADCAVVVDGLFGTGLDRPLTGIAADVVSAVNDCDAAVVALDLPSGLDCDTGQPLGPCVRADVTATFVAPKLGFTAPGAAAWTGRVEVVSIGAPWTAPPASSEDGGR